MEVDRISRIGSIGPQASPSWSGTQVRRKRFVQEFDPPPPDDQEEQAGQQPSADDTPPDEEEPPAEPEPEPGADKVLNVLA